MTSAESTERGKHHRGLAWVALTSALALVLVSGLGCPGSGSQLPGQMMDNTNEMATLAWIQSNVFTPMCTECHVPGGPGPMPLDSEMVSFDNLVSVQSVEIGSLNRVEPGDPENSYLVHKVEGRSSIVGQTMPPPPRAMLSDVQIQAIIDWIEAGAEP